MFFVFWAAKPPKKQKTYLFENFSLRGAIGLLHVVTAIIYNFLLICSDKSVLADFPKLKLIASGGVSSITDLEHLNEAWLLHRHRRESYL